MSDEQQVTYPIDDVLAALEHAEHLTLEQIEARIKEIEAQEEPLPLEIAEFESCSWLRCTSGSSTWDFREFVLMKMAPRAETRAHLSDLMFAGARPRVALAAQWRK